MQRVVYLPQGRCVTLGNYVHAWRLALTAPDTAVFNKPFAPYPQTKQEVLREFRFGLHDRINRRIDGFPGTLRPLPHPDTRKYDYEWQLETYRAAIQLNQPCLIIDWLPPWLKTRFAYRLRDSLHDW
jgi:hypothetical protein